MNKLVITALLMVAVLSPALGEPDSAARGERDFRVCAPCHSLEPDRNMTGPSLAGLWGRKAGSLPSFERYSDALKSSEIIWDDRSLDGWLTDPDGMVPDNEMPFDGIKNPRDRADLLAFLKEATKPGAAPQQSAQAQMGGKDGMMGGMGGMMGGVGDSNLKSLEPSRQVQAIWAPLDVGTLDEAKQALAAREGIEDRNIRHSIGFWSPADVSNHHGSGAIGRWALERDFNGVVWTALKPKMGSDYRIPDQAEVVAHLTALSGNAQEVAKEYVQLAPRQITTPYRNAIEDALGWTPLGLL
jgi:cytochrome c